jgi:hypothetical protein
MPHVGDVEHERYKIIDQLGEYNDLLIDLETKYFKVFPYAIENVGYYEKFYLSFNLKVFTRTQKVLNIISYLSLMKNA